MLKSFGPQRPTQIAILDNADPSFRLPASAMKLDVNRPLTSLRSNSQRDSHLLPVPAQGQALNHLRSEIPNDQRFRRTEPLHWKTHSNW